MQVKKFLSAALISIFLSSIAYAQIVSSKGIGSTNFGFRLNAENRAEAFRNAKINALEAYIAESGSAKLRLFELRREEFLRDIDRYILSAVVISDQEDKKSKTYQVVIRADINTTLLQAKLDIGSSPATAGAESEKSLLTFLFVARSQDSVQRYDERVFKRSDESAKAEVNIKGRNGYSEKTREGESFSGSSISTSGSRQVNESVSAKADEKLTVTSETGGSTTSKAEKISWKVSNANEVNTVVTGLFSAAGFEVAEAEYVEGVNVEKIRVDFGTGNDLAPATLRAAASAIRAADIRYLAYGTLDVGVRDIDPVSGSTRIFVTVTSKVLDVSRQIPRVISSVGPVQFAGLGPNETVARTNALQEAAGKAAQQMSNELKIKSVN